MEKDSIGSSKKDEDQKFQNAVPVTPIFEKFSKHKDVTLVYGEPIELENKKVLPVAKIRYMFGGGGGSSEGSNQSPSGQGGGGGGHISVSPLGVYEITSHKTTFKPAVDLKFILLLVSIFTFGLTWLFLRKPRTTYKRK